MEITAKQARANAEDKNSVNFNEIMLTIKESSNRGYYECNYFEVIIKEIYTKLIDLGYSIESKGEYFHIIKW